MKRIDDMTNVRRSISTPGVNPQRQIKDMTFATKHKVTKDEKVEKVVCGWGYRAVKWGQVPKK